MYQPPAPVRQTRPRTQRRPRTAPVAREDKLMIVVAVLLMGVASLGLVWRFTQINDFDYRIGKLERQISTLQQANASLTVEFNRLSSPSQVESRAVQELGMQWPTQGQIVNVVQGEVPADH